MGERQKRKLQVSCALHLLHPENFCLLLNPIDFFRGPESKVPKELRPDYNEGRDGTSLREAVCKQEDAAVVTGTGKRHLWGLP